MKRRSSDDARLLRNEVAYHPSVNGAKHRLAVPWENGAVKKEAKHTCHMCTPQAVCASEDLGRGDAAKNSTAPFRKFEDFLSAR